MKLKLDDKGSAVVRNDKPVYVKDDGTEVEFDVVGTVATITRLNGEAKTHREARESAETSLKAYDGIEPKAARQALEVAGKLDAKQLLDAGKVDEMRAAAIKATEDKYAPIVAERDSLAKMYNDEVIGGSFARSKFINEKLAIPSDFAQARFEKNFSIVDGKVVAKDANGNQIYSPASPGNPASFDEAIEFLVSQYPQKDSILKGTGSSGGGSQQSSGTQVANGKISYAAWKALPVEQQAAQAKNVAA
jgi:hypothetical protein